MRAEIKLLHQRTRTTTVYVTHDQVEAMTLGDRIAVMKDGQVQQFGTPEDIYSRPANRFVAEFIGSPTMNFVGARFDGSSAQAQGQVLPLSEAQRLALQPLAGQDLLYGLRPEDVRLSGEGLPGRLHMIEPTGPDTYATVETAVGHLTSRVPGALHAQVGDTVHLQWAPQAVHLFQGQDERRIA